MCNSRQVIHLGMQRIERAQSRLPEDFGVKAVHFWSDGIPKLSFRLLSKLDASDTAQIEIEYPQISRQATPCSILGAPVVCSAHLQIPRQGTPLDHCFIAVPPTCEFRGKQSLGDTGRQHRHRSAHLHISRQAVPAQGSARLPNENAN
jgi:hypothetical protein